MINRSFFILALFVLIAVAFNLHAGPPLICHSVDVPSGKSLPWGPNAFEKDKNYNASNVVRDTLDLLTPELPIPTRMETLRRATLYIDRDRERANALLGSLMARALDNEAIEKPSALSYFDAGYLAACYHQTGTEATFGPAITKGEGASSIPGYAWVVKAISLKSGKPEMELAAALIAVESRGPEGQAHLKNAFAAGLPNSPQTEGLLQWLAQIHGTTLDGLRAKFNLTDARSHR